MIDRRGLLHLGIAGVGATLLPGRLFGQTADPLASVDPELRPMARAMLKVEASGTAFRPPTNVPLPPGVVERSIASTGPAPPVVVYVINTRPAGPPRGAILHIHGGGFTGGSARTGTRALKALADALDCVIVTVEYRLAPATRFPGALEDNYAALRWLHANAASLGADPGRIALLGESAGGGHAAMLALAARDRKEVPIAFQALVYPMLDDRTGSTGSTVAAPLGTGAIIWTAKDNRAGWSALLGHPAGSRRAPAGAVPARFADLRGLPPTFIGVGTLDLFVDEDIAFARRLVAAGVPTELLVVPGAFHGFELVAPNAGVSRRFTAALRGALTRALAPVAG